MAPPMIRRPGWSRRAQYSLFFGFVALVIGAVIGIALLVVSLVAPRTFGEVRGAALDFTRPISESGSAVVATIQGLASGAGDYWDAADQNSELRAERDRLRRRLIDSETIRRENITLKRTIGLIERSRDPVATGRIIGSSQDSPRRFAILSVGSTHGVRNGMPVRSADGLIGRIVDTGRSASRVLLVSDRANIVPSLLLRTNEPVIVKGRGDGTIDVRPLEVGRNPFLPGDIIATSGTGGLYPPLIPIGKIIRRDDDGAIALPLANPAESAFAMVEPPYEPAAQVDEEDPIE